MEEATKKRESQKPGTSDAAASLHLYHLCGRNFRAQIGLTSHFCAHRNILDNRVTHHGSYSRTNDGQNINTKTAS